MSENTGSTPKFLTLSSYPRAIVHIDCDAFFASCEQAQDPRLKGRPVVTGKERGIIACASYEAKRLGVKRGVSLLDARRIVPGLVVLPSDYETYSLYSERLFSIFRRYTPMVEEFSIDEGFLDITGLRRIYRTGYSGIARTIKEAVKKELDITVSVGLSLTKTLAKICSRYKKPDGFTAVPGRRLHEFLKGIELGAVCGFGPNTVELLAKHGLRDVLDYTNLPLPHARRLLGKIGDELWHELRGEPVYALQAGEKKKYLSISKSKTFSPPSRDRDHVKAQLMRNLESAFMKLRRHSQSAKGIVAHLRAADFSSEGAAAELDRHSSSTLDFTKASALLFDQLFVSGRSYRATGVVLFDLVTEGIDSRTLFDDPAKIVQTERLTRAIDSVNERYGKYAVHLAASDGAITKGATGSGAQEHTRRSLPWRKGEILKGETFRRRLSIPLLNLRQL